MDVKSNDLLHSIFQQIQGDKTIDYVKALFYKYDENAKEYLSQNNAKIQFYNENFKNKRDLQNYQYDEFLKNKQVLLNKYKEKQSKDIIYKILELQFPYQHIDDIYSHNIIYNKNLDGSNKRHLDISNNDIVLPRKKKKQTKSDKSNFWHIEDEDHQKNLKYWEKNDEAKMFSFYNQELPYDNEDAEALLNSLLTSASLNAFLYNYIKDKKLFKKYIIMNAEFYYDLSEMIENDEDLDNLTEGYLKHFDNDWNNKTIFIPINIDNIHWIASIIDPKEEKIYILDPYGHENPDISDKINIWRNWLLNKHSNLVKKEFEFVYDTPNIVLQSSQDTENCGIYTIMYFIYYINNGEFPTENDFNENELQNIRNYIYNSVTNIVKCPIGKKLNPKTKRCIKDK